MTRNLKIIIAIIGIAVLAAGAFLARQDLKALFSQKNMPAVPDALTYEEALVESSAKDPVITETAEQPVQDSSPAAQDDSGVIPASYNLAVPFQSQAPHGNWDQPYQDACEEASLIMANAFFAARALSADQMDAEIKNLVAWQMDTFGYYEDTTADEVARTAREYFGLSATVTTDVTVENIKRQIREGKLVIVPAAGKLLPNPNFRNGGPIYHMLVIRGYTDTHFITNDPGTRLGKEFLYTYSSLINAVHDWPEGMAKDEVTLEDMLQGRKVIIVVDK